MSNTCQRPFVPCGSYENKSVAKSAIADISDENEKWEVGPTHTYVDRQDETQTRYSIVRTQ
jgi:hypothetical protein